MNPKAFITVTGETMMSLTTEELQIINEHRKQKSKERQVQLLVEEVNEYLMSVAEKLKELNADIRIGDNISRYPVWLQNFNPDKTKYDI